MYEERSEGDTGLALHRSLASLLHNVSAFDNRPAASTSRFHRTWFSAHMPLMTGNGKHHTQMPARVAAGSGHGGLWTYVG